MFWSPWKLLVLIPKKISYRNVRKINSALLCFYVYGVENTGYLQKMFVDHLVVKASNFKALKTSNMVNKTWFPNKMKISQAIVSQHPVKHKNRGWGTNSPQEREKMKKACKQNVSLQLSKLCTIG